MTDVVWPAASEQSLDAIASLTQRHLHAISRIKSAPLTPRERCLFEISLWRALAEGCIALERRAGSVPENYMRLIAEIDQLAAGVAS